jgi:long-chain acyl-CoA synthetase
VALGVGRGDRVLVFLDNSIAAAVSIFAALKAGAVFSPISASTKAAKLAYIIDNCRAGAVITRTRMAPIVAEALAQAETRPLTIVAGDPLPALPDAHGFEALIDGDFPPAEAPASDADLAMLIYTSGSTGQPKGVMMTHANIDAASLSITTYLENTPDDVILNVLPLAFDYGLYQLLMAVRVGATLVLEKSFAFPQAVFETMRREQVTGLPLVPTMAAMILNMPSLEPGSFPSLRYVTNTAAALPPSHIEKLRRLLPGAAVFSMYGLTECKRCTYLPPARLDDKTGSVGIAIPGTEAFVVDEAGEQVAPGVIGELVIRGPHVMQGYWENPEATARMLRPGFNGRAARLLYTGDLFYAATPKGSSISSPARTTSSRRAARRWRPRRSRPCCHAHVPGSPRRSSIGRIRRAMLGHAIGALDRALAIPALTQREIADRHCASAISRISWCPSASSSATACPRPIPEN